MFAKYMQSQGNSCALGALRRGLKWLALWVVLGSGPSVALPAHAPRRPILTVTVMPSPGPTRVTGPVLASVDPSQAPLPGQATATAPTQAASGGRVAELHTQRELGEFLVIRKNGDRIEGSSGSLEAARLTGVSVDGRTLDISRDDIHTLYLKEGSLAGQMALYGAGVGLAFSSLVLLRAGLDDRQFFDRDGAGTVSVALIGGSTALGALIGLAVGASKSDWRVEPVVVPGQQFSLHLAASL